MGLAVFFALSQGHIKRLGSNDAVIHLRDGLSGLLGAGETDEAKSAAASLLAHDLGGGDGTIGSEFLTKSFVIDGVIQILDVQVDTLVTSHAFHFESFEFLFQFRLSFSLLLSAADIQRFAFDFFRVEIRAGGLRLFGLFVADESKSFAFAIFTCY